MFLALCSTVRQDDSVTMEIIDSVIIDIVITDSVTYSLARDSDLLLIVLRLTSVAALVTIKL